MVSLQQPLGGEGRFQAPQLLVQGGDVRVVPGQVLTLRVGAVGEHLGRG